MDIKRMLEDQASIVEAAHKTRLVALKKYGLGSSQYRAANQVYEDEQHRYDMLDLKGSIESFSSRLEEGMQAINPMFQGFYQELEQIKLGLEGQADPLGEIIDVAGHLEPYQPKRNQDSLPSNSHPELTPSQRLQQLRNRYHPQLPKPRE